MKFQCQNPTCGKLFHYTAKLITADDEKLKGILETQVCPYCQSKDFTEYIEPIVQESVSNVYIYDLTSGAQIDLDILLAEGYRIQQRYVKQYFLEKPKEMAKA